MSIEKSCVRDSMSDVSVGVLSWYISVGFGILMEVGDVELGILSKLEGGGVIGLYQEYDAYQDHQYFSINTQHPQVKAPLLGKMVWIMLQWLESSAIPPPPPT